MMKVLFGSLALALVSLMAACGGDDSSKGPGGTSTTSGTSGTSTTVTTTVTAVDGGAAPKNVGFKKFSDDDAVTTPAPAPTDGN